MQYSGEAIFVVLIAILALKPIAKYLKKPKLLILRRYLGWISGLMGFTHVSFWVAYYMESITFLLMSFTQLWFLLGLFAMSSLFLMGGTSNNYSVKKLGGKIWKKIQVYGIHTLVILGLIHAHLAIRGYDPTIWLWTLPLIYLLLIRLMIPFLNFMIVVIGAIAVSWLINSDNSTVTSVVTEVAFPTTIDNTSIEGYTHGYDHNLFSQDAKIPHTWTEEDFRLCNNEEPANLDTRERVYCRSGEVHEKTKGK